MRRSREAKETRDREASQQIEGELYRLWSWLRDLHEVGRPRVAVPPTREDAGPVTLPL